MDELKELRDQMADMRRSLDNYSIINDRLMQTVMRERSKGLNWYVNAEIISIPFISLMFFGIFLSLHMSIWIPITVTVGCIVSTLFDLKTMKISKKKINSLSLRDLRAFLIRQKRMRTVQLAIELPLVIAMVTWFMLAYLENEVIFGNSASEGPAVWKYVTVAIMLAIVCVLVMVIYRKSQNVNDRMIEDIDSMT